MLDLVTGFSGGGMILVRVSLYSVVLGEVVVVTGGIWRRRERDG